MIPTSHARYCRRTAALVPILLAAALLPSCGAKRGTSENVILIVVDTFRADHASAYGYWRPTTPTLDSLASRSVLFKHAYSTASWTIPSIGSILTGTYPMTHGAIHLNSKLPEKAVTLGEILQSRGYATAGVVSHIVLTSSRQFDQGFGHFHAVLNRRQHDFLSTGKVTDRAIEELDFFARQEKPFFLFVHYFDPHYNYIRHPEYGFAPDSAGRLHGGEDLEELQELDRLEPAEYAFLASIYDEEVRFTDAGIGRLLGHLRKLGLEDRTLVILTGDHGEEFGEHGGLGHSRTLYNEVLHVPLVIGRPGSGTRPRTVVRPVSLVSLAPTILELTGVPADTLRFQGESLVPLLSDREEGSEDDVIYSSVDFEGFSAHKKAILSGGLKLIYDEPTRAVELFDEGTDPNERTNLADRSPEVVRGLLPVLGQYVRAARRGALPSEVAPMSREELEALRSLGYVQ